MLWSVLLLFIVNYYVQASTDLVDNNSESITNGSAYDVNISLVKNSVLYGILSESVINDYETNGFCSRDLKSMYNGINNKIMWAIKGNYEQSLFIVSILKISE